MKIRYFLFGSISLFFFPISLLASSSYLKQNDINERSKSHNNFSNKQTFLIANQYSRDLSGYDLSGMSLGMLNFANVNFTGANLSNGKFFHSNFTNANFTEASLRNANFTNAKLDGANFNGADLSNADLTNAKLTNADLSKAKLYGTYEEIFDCPASLPSGWICKNNSLIKRDNVVDPIISPYGEWLGRTYKKGLLLSYEKWLEQENKKDPLLSPKEWLDSNYYEYRTSSDGYIYFPLGAESKYKKYKRLYNERRDSKQYNLYLKKEYQLYLENPNSEFKTKIAEAIPTNTKLSFLVKTCPRSIPIGWSCEDSGQTISSLKENDMVLIRKSPKSIKEIAKNKEFETFEINLPEGYEKSKCLLKDGSGPVPHPSIIYIPFLKMKKFEKVISQLDIDEYMALIADRPFSNLFPDLPGGTSGYPSSASICAEYAMSGKDLPCFCNK